MYVSDYVLCDEQCQLVSLQFAIHCVPSIGSYS